ncbi:MAG: pilus assembly protein PilM [Planctomycetales bacterium]|nr:pilus assembly protein PilM [Planctomycetales bacterium]
MSVKEPPGYTDKDIQCEECGKANDADRRFCSACGTRLWQPCHSCESQNAVNATFCGSCGENLAEQLSKSIERINKLLGNAKRSCQEGNYYQAIDILRSITDYGDSRLQDFTAKSEKMQVQVNTLRVEKESMLEELHANAQEHFAAKQYRQAAEWMAKIPVGMRNAKIRQTASAIEECLSEIKSLSAIVQEGLAKKQYSALLPIVERLCELKVNDDRLLELREKLHAHQTSSQATAAKSRAKAAAAFIKQERYKDAAAELRRIDDSAELDGTLQQTIDQAREICWLYNELEALCYVTPQGLALVKRFQKFCPQSEAGKQLVQRIRKAASVRPKTPRERNVPIRPMNCASLDNVPVVWWNGFADCNVDSQASAVLKERPGQFTVAYGLALQGIQQSAVKTNLLFETRPSVLRKISARTRSLDDSVWGIDVGASGVKAILLTFDKKSDDKQISVDSAIRIPYSSPLTTATADEERAVVVADAVQRLVDEAAIGKAQAVVNVSGPKTLGRFFSVPTLKPKKLKDLIQYEAKHQIPVPEPEVTFDYHLWQSNEQDKGSVCLVAARRDQIRPTLDVFEDSEIQVTSVQSTCVALYNACYSQFLTSDSESNGHKSNCVAALDVGVESSVLVLASSNGFRFRNLPYGLHRLNQMLANRFGCNYKRAELMRLRSESNPWLHKVDSALSEGFADLRADLLRSLHSMIPDVGKPEKLIVTGGGSNQHGLIRSFLETLQDSQSD